MQLPEFLIFSLEYIFFLLTSNIFRIKTGCSLISFDVIFPMSSIEFLKSLNFGYISQKKNAKKKPEMQKKTNRAFLQISIEIILNF